MTRRGGADEIWSRRSDSNRGHPHYRCGALPLSYGGLEPKKRIELLSWRYECPALPLSYSGMAMKDQLR